MSAKPAIKAGGTICPACSAPIKAGRTLCISCLRATVKEALRADYEADKKATWKAEKNRLIMILVFVPLFSLGLFGVMFLISTDEAFISLGISMLVYASIAGEAFGLIGYSLLPFLVLRHHYRTFDKTITAEIEKRMDLFDLLPPEKVPAFVRDVLAALNKGRKGETSLPRAPPRKDN